MIRNICKRLRKIWNRAFTFYERRNYYRSTIIKLHRHSIFRVVWKQSRDTKNRQRANGVPSFVQSRFSIAFFLLLHFPSNLSVGRISAEVRALWMARVSSTPPPFPPMFHSVLLVPRVFPDRRVRPRPGGNFQSQLPSSPFPSLWTTGAKKSYRTQNHRKITTKDVIK